MGYPNPLEHALKKYLQPSCPS
ncbi:hypothetical protein Golax_025807 [Gossypium laxum]|uniref:Uncharacterized protein n=1 Tax=Gossypium laxum TaxID=34288 RepID=A0A7J9B0A0_9ROSI|nr:hypothetical protein [Gossypium laxum]